MQKSFFCSFNPTDQIYENGLLKENKIKYNSNEIFTINNILKTINYPIITSQSVSLICDGEIYNYKLLYELINVTPITKYPEYEIIIWLYKKYGIKYTLQVLDGIFSFILIDNNVYNANFKMYVAIDQYGIKPLYLAFSNELNNKYSKYNIIINGNETTATVTATENETDIDTDTETENNILITSQHTNLDISDNINNINKNNNIISKKYYNSNDVKNIDTFSFSNDIECLKDWIDVCKTSIISFPSGSLSTYYLESKVFSKWTIENEFYKYHNFGFNSLLFERSIEYTLQEIGINIERYLKRSIEKRCNYFQEKEYTIACILNENITSTILMNLVCEYYKTYYNKNKILINTYSIGSEGSQSIKYNRKVADYFYINHTEFIVENVENMTENQKYKILCEKIKEHDNTIQILFSDLGSVELCMGIKPDKNGCLTETYIDVLKYDNIVKNELENMYMKNAKMEKIFNMNDFILCSPFLDTSFIQYYLSIPSQMRIYDNEGYFIIKQSFDTILSPFTELYN
jgi:asparagine synthetase B (glutamine-hydrolysing)